MLYLLPFILYKPRFPLGSSISHHILHITPVLIRNMLLYLLLRQPLEIAQSKHIPLQIRLSSHDPSFHEERSGSLLLEVSRFGMEAWIDDMVPDWDMSNDPGIHVDTRSLDEYSFRALHPISPAISAS
jgi:hypothetical protein